MAFPEKKVVYTAEQALEALQHYCAYQDRCHQEARDKLYELGYGGDAAEEVIVELIKEKYLDEERFARSYARGKFKMKKWGRYRIRRELKSRKLSDYCIRKAMTEIDDKEYYGTLCSELERRNALEKPGQHPYLKRRRLADYMVKRGYESGLVWQALDDLEF
ncbi:regulatory protein [Neolewinella xylanilytica]|uniref:Regulatory protein RecX n=1 Tax=Neolewinella xylanilytica TaxID=1514080 RepID=A0A2S6I314_9BACT|nr:regulatory protein RecX [Neolewinella xylanilytica]PPK85574.1 regulatory protein [Neolewinella xylanilytica]